MSLDNKYCNIDYKINLDKLVKTVEIFNGLIYGDFISQYYIKNFILGNEYGNELDFENINIIFNTFNDRVNFLRLIHNIFEIYNSNYRSQNNFKILIKYDENNLNKPNLKSQVKNLNIYNNIIYNDLNFYTYFLDINLISIEKGGLNIIKYENSNNNLGIFNTILNRIINKKFSFIDDYSYDIFNNINKCVELINNGWIMDDFYLKDKTSVFFFWKNIHKYNIRTTFTHIDNEKIKSDDLCSICSSNFKDNDIIINTKCNHNFHWDCNYGGTSKNISGLKNWISKFSHKCPICRYEYCI
jgi:hypothetical protein